MLISSARGRPRRTTRLILPFELRAEEPPAHDSSHPARRSAFSSPRGRCCAAAIAARRRRPRRSRRRRRRRPHRVRCADAAALARAAYHLGNRHAPVQVGAGWLRIAADDVLAECCAGSAPRSRVARAVRAGSRRVRSGHHAHSGDAKHAGIIHDFATRPPRHDADRRSAAIVRCLSFACCSLRARRCRSARTAIRKGSRRRWRRASCTMRRARRRGSAICSSSSSRAPKRRSLWRLLEAAQRCDWPSFASWNAWFRASRETAELRAETEQMGGSLAKLAAELDLVDAEIKGLADGWSPSRCLRRSHWPRAGSESVRSPRLPHIWAWLENQVLAAIKLVPLGPGCGTTLARFAGRRRFPRSSTRR